MCIRDRRGAFVYRIYHEYASVNRKTDCTAGTPARHRPTAYNLPLSAWSIRSAVKGCTGYKAVQDLSLIHILKTSFSGSISLLSVCFIRSSYKARYLSLIHISLAFTHTNRNHTYWLYGLDYQIKEYTYENKAIPKAQFTGELSYFIPCLLYTSFFL